MLRVGVDIVHISKMRERAQSEEFLKRTFHQNEIRNGTAQHLAGVFAAKEAFFKAVGQDVSWLDLEIFYEHGRPMIRVAPHIGTMKSVDISISHDGDYAIACAIVEL